MPSSEIVFKYINLDKSYVNTKFTSVITGHKDFRE